MLLWEVCCSIFFFFLRRKKKVFFLGKLREFVVEGSSVQGSKSAYHGVAPGSPRGQRFSGLMNQGNTCYLNSLIQAMYLLPEIRRDIYSLKPEDLVVPLGDDDGGGAGEKEEKLSEEDQAALDDLTAMGFDPSKVKRAIKRFPFDPDNVQRIDFVLSEDADVMDAIEESKPKENTAPKVKERRIPKELQILFARLQSADANAQSTKKLTDCFGAGFSAGVQHDVHELNRILFDRIEKQLRGTKIQGMINHLYRGTVVNRIVCKSCGHKSEREEDFLDVSLIVGDFKNVEDSLSAFVEDEELSGNNLYECGGCNKKCEALKGVRFRTLPPLLILSLSRFEYDKQTWQRVKNMKRFPFPRVLDNMSLYMDEPDKSVDAYELFGVVIHRGREAGHGHYHAYLLDVLNESGKVGLPTKDVLGEDKEYKDEEAFQGWFDFNDSTVRPIASETLESQFGGEKDSSECGYMLMYRQKDHPALLRMGDLPPALPVHLAEEIERENQELQKKREEWEENKNKIEINLYTPSALEQDGEKIVRLKDNTEDDEYVSFKTVVIDRRKTLGDLKHAALESLPDVCPPVDQMTMHRIRFMEQKRVKFLRPLHRPLSNEGKELSFNDSALLDDLSTITHGCDVLVWDGTHLLDEEPFEVVYDLITVCVTLYEQDGDEESQRKIDIQLREISTLQDLRMMLKEQHGIAMDCWLFRLDYAHPTLLEGEDKTMRELYLTDHVRISAEAAKENIKDALVLKDQQDDEKIEVFVWNQCNDTDFKESVPCSFGMSVWDLKMTIIKKIGTLNEKSAMRLRRTTSSGAGEGSLFQDERASLKKAGVQNFMRIIIEYGEAPDLSTVSIKYLWGTAAGTKLVHEIQNTCVEVNITIGALKERIMKALHLESAPATHRLRKTDFWGNQKEIYEDEDKTLKSLHFKDSDCVWLEEGTLPPKGQMEIQIELQTSLFDQSAKEEAEGDAEKKKVSSSSVQDMWDTVDVAVLQLPKTSKLSDLFEMIRKDAVVGGLVEGRDFRLWHRGKLLRGENRTLKKLGVQTSSIISMQVLKEGEKESPELLGDDGVLLVLRERLSETKTFGVPLETVASCGHRGHQHFISKKMLMQHIYQSTGISEGEPLFVAKLVSQSGRWKPLIDPQDQQEQDVEMVDMKKESDAKGVRALRQKQLEMQRSSDIYLSDGDIIVYKVISKDIANNDNFTLLPTVEYQSTRQNFKASDFDRAMAESRKTYRGAKDVALQIEDDEFWN